VSPDTSPDGPANTTPKTSLDILPDANGKLALQPVPAPAVSTSTVSSALPFIQGDAQWIRRRNITFTILGWIAMVGVALWLAAQVWHAIIVLVMAAVVAYALFPAVQLLHRWLPRWLAILLVYLALFAAIGGFAYLLGSTAVTQFRALSDEIKFEFTSGTGTPAPPSPLVQQLNSTLGPLLVPLGRTITNADVNAFSNWILQLLAVDAVPVLRSLITGIFDTVLVVVVSVYLLIGGDRLAVWANVRIPVRYRPRAQALLDELQRVVGGYIRGQLSMALLIGVLVGAGMSILQVPFALLLGMMAFVLEFIPIIGTLISGAVCVLVALTHGGLPPTHGGPPLIHFDPLLALVVLAYFVVVHVIEGDVVGPRVVGQAVGVHPVVSIIAVAAGAELFHVWGALLAAPLAGLSQVIIVDIWRQWRNAHAAEFAEQMQTAPADEVPIVPLVDSAAAAVLLPKSESAKSDSAERGSPDADVAGDAAEDSD
jgi:predicted PurR-regulated permease PerM